MKLCKRLLMGFLALILLIGAVPLGCLRVQAATPDPAENPYFEDVQCAEFPMNYLQITRTNTMLDADQDNTKLNGSTSGHRAYSFDLTGGNKKVYAPFDLKVVYIYQPSHTVFVQSLKPVRFANGTIDYMTCVLIHDNNISNLKVGQEFKQGQHFYDQGDYGNSDGVHLHLEAAVGKDYHLKSNGKKETSFGTILTKVRQNSVQVHEAFFLSPAVAKGKGKQDITVSKENKSKTYLDWKVRQEVIFHSNVSGIADLTRHYPLGEAFTDLPTPVNEGKFFAGWYTANTGGTKVDANTVVTEKHTQLYARWQNIPADVSKFVSSKNVTMKSQNITPTDAKLSVTVNLSSMYSIVPYKTGFYIGTDPNYLTKCSEDKLVFGNTLKKGVSFQLSDCGYTLRPDTTYYYQFFVSTDSANAEFRSKVLSFKTPADTTAKAARSHPQWRKQAASVTDSSVTISTRVNFMKIQSGSYTGNTSVKVEKVGFYLGEAKNKLVKSDVTTAINASKKNLDISFNLTQKGVELKPGTTYYYKFYLVVNGIEYSGGIRSFKTKGTAPSNTQKPAQSTTALNPTWSKYNATNITQTNAKISATVSYGKKLKADSCGFYLGTAKDKLTKVKKGDTISESRTYTNMSYDLNKYGFNLKAGTTYYYQFYLIVSGKEYKSEVKSFTTEKAKEQAPTTPALNLSWSKYNASEISETNAKISATVNYGKKLKADSCGFYLGTAKDNLTKAKKSDTITQTREYTDMWYDLNKYGFNLKAGTTYYYQFYLVVNGKEYKSEVKSFTTAKKAPELSPVWSDYKVSKITKTDATIAGKVTYGKTVKPERCGFYLGTSKDNLVKADKYDPINAQRTYSGMSYGLNKYGFTLKAGTTYYYRFYVIVNGEEYVSDIKSFTTSK